MDYLNEYLRMCTEYGTCDGCPMDNARITCDCDPQVCRLWMLNHPDETKTIIADWSKAHLGPVYPTPNEWWLAKYPDAYTQHAPCYDFFMPRSTALEEHCDGATCDNCRNTPIPAEFARVMGVEPKEGRDGQETD